MRTGKQVKGAATSLASPVLRTRESGHQNVHFYLKVFPEEKKKYAEMANVVQKNNMCFLNNEVKPRNMPTDC